MAYKRAQIISFFVLLLIIGILVLQVLRPFVNILLLGIILAILVHPLYVRLRRSIKSENIASLLTVLLIILIILIPVVFFGQLLLTELLHLYDRVQSGELVLTRSQIVHHLPEQVQVVLERFSRDINALLGRITSNAFESFSSLVSNVAGFFVSLFLLFFALFYILRDGDHIKNVVMDISPMATNQEDVLITKIVLAVNGVVKGSFLTALVQGAVATVGFLIFSVPNPLIWGLFTVLAALVPTVGTSLSLVPAVVYLLITGHVPQAIGLAIWGIVAVSLIDNILGPRFVGTRAKLHPLLVLLSVLGGISFFGFLGFLIGPILMAIFIAMIDMYRTDFKSQLQ